MCYTWYRVLILVPRVHVVYFSSLSQVVNYRCMSITKGKSSMDTMRDLCTTSRPAFQKDVTSSADQVWEVDYPCALQLSHCTVHPHCKQCSWISKQLKLDKRLGESLASRDQGWKALVSACQKHSRALAVRNSRAYTLQWRHINYVILTSGHFGAQRKMSDVATGYIIVHVSLVPRLSSAHALEPGNEAKHTHTHMNNQWNQHP